MTDLNINQSQSYESKRKHNSGSYVKTNGSFAITNLAKDVLCTANKLKAVYMKMDNDLKKS